jgi:hypothetical protein
MSGTHYLSAKSFPDRLVSQAYAENRHPSSKVTHQINADAGFVGRARAGGDDNLCGTHVLDLSQGDLVIATNFDLRAQFPKILNQVVGKGVVVVEYEDQVGSPYL